jgi:hypothetical protein
MSVTHRISPQFFHNEEPIAVPYGSGQKYQLHCQISDDPELFRAVAEVCLGIAVSLDGRQSRTNGSSTQEEVIEDWRHVKGWSE